MNHSLVNAAIHGFKAVLIHLSPSFFKPSCLWDPSQSFFLHCAFIIQAGGLSHVFFLQFKPTWGSLGQSGRARFSSDGMDPHPIEPFKEQDRLSFKKGRKHPPAQEHGGQMNQELSGLGADHFPFHVTRLIWLFRLDWCMLFFMWMRSSRELEKRRMFGCAGSCQRNTLHNSKELLTHGHSVL